MASQRQPGFQAPVMLAAMKNILIISCLCMAAGESVPTVVMADEPAVPASSAMQSSTPAPSSGTRYGPFDWLDHRSFYSQGDFPEPFLVDDSGLEINEARLDWLHTHTGGSTGDTITAEVEKGFGLLTLELEVPYVREQSGGQTTDGFDNIDLGARYPFYQFVSTGDFFDTTFGAAVELGIPVDSTISKNTEFVPKMFNDTKIGEHLTVQSIYGYSTLFGPGDDGGRQTFEYGFVFGYTLQHQELPLPGIQQFIPMFELSGQTGLNQGEAGVNALLGDAGFRVNLNTIGRVQPRLGVVYVFPLDDHARADVQSGVMVSLVFEY